MPPKSRYVRKDAKLAVAQLCSYSSACSRVTWPWLYLVVYTRGSAVEHSVQLHRRAYHVLYVGQSAVLSRCPFHCLDGSGKTAPSSACCRNRAQPTNC